MTIVTLKSPEVFGAVDSITGRQHGPDYRRSRGVRMSAEGTLTNAATDSNGSTYTLAELPSDAILCPESAIDLQSWGFTVAHVGTDGVETGLLSVADTGVLAAASTFFAQFDANWGKELWDLLGLAEDPGGKIAIRLYTAADAAGAGSAKFSLVWLEN